MAYVKNLDHRHVSSTRLSSRFKQILVLGAVVLIGMLISASVNAIPSKTTVVAKKQSTLRFDISKR